MNAIKSINLFWTWTWVFNDPQVGLHEEPFVAGADEFISDMLVYKGIPENELKKQTPTVVFSETYFPDHEFYIEHIGVDEHDSGNFYYHSETERTLWLCPALLKYFETAPKQIYIAVKL